MARKKTTNPKTGKSGKTPPQAAPTVKRRTSRPRWFQGVLYLVLSVYLLASLLFYSPEQNPKLNTAWEEASRAPVGVVGVYLGYFAFYWFGIIAWALPVFLFWMAACHFFPRRLKLGRIKLITIPLSLMSACILARMFEPGIESIDFQRLPEGWGGVIGNGIYGDNLRHIIGPLGTFFAAGSLFLITTIVTFIGDPNEVGQRLVARFKEWSASRRSRAIERKAARRKAEDEKRKAREAAVREAQNKAPKPGKKIALKKENGKEKESGETPSGQSNASILSPFDQRAGGTPPSPGRKTPPDTASSAAAGNELEERSRKRAPKLGLFGKKEDPKKPPLEADAKDSATGEVTIVTAEKVERAAIPRPQKKGNYIFPPTHLLQEAAPPPESNHFEAHDQTQRLLIEILGQFGVEVEAGSIQAGPVITRYEVKPAKGVRVEKILNLERNLALGLKAKSVRILAPVPGKGTVGVELPNADAAAVCLREILESKPWADFTQKAEIPIALGKEVNGKVLTADLSRMPHLLIAGATGAGKTVCINTIVTSLLYNSSPEDLRFVMVDPKIVEMQVYNDLPHMLIPVVTDPRKVPAALKYLLREMERRYHLFASEGVRNIAGYNRKIAQDRSEEARQQEQELDASLSPEERAALNSIEVPRDSAVEMEGEKRKLPYIVTIIDELADLMMVAPAEVEAGVARLAQLARAAGIHLVVATQRPSVNVITGLIKANLPSRIAFKVAAKVDSRTILDANGADGLIGRGDMLFLPPGSHDLIRAQGAFVADEETTGIVQFLHENNGEPEIDEAFLEHVETSTDEDGEGDADSEGFDGGDPLLGKALEVIRSTKRASTSMLQRRLRIGYNRAARIMEELEERGIVGPENGSSPREILRDPDEF